MQGRKTLQLHAYTAIWHLFYYTKASLKVVLTLSFDVEVFTLITGSPLDLSITTVLSVPRLARKQNTSEHKLYARCSNIPVRLRTVKILSSKLFCWGFILMKEYTDDSNSLSRFGQVGHEGSRAIRNYVSVFWRATVFVQQENLRIPKHASCSF